MHCWRFGCIKRSKYSSLFTSLTRRQLANKPIMGKKALLLGVYNKSTDGDGFLWTNSAKQFDDKLNGQLTNTINICGPVKKGKYRIFYGLSEDYPVVSVVGLGPHNAGYNDTEDIDEGRENVRNGVAIGAEAIRDAGLDVDELDIDDCNDPQAAAEGVHLSLHYFDELKQDSLKKKPMKLNLFQLGEDKKVESKWTRGVVLAEGQNLARRLMELPANHLTPTRFAEIAQELFQELNVKLQIRDRQWAESMKMGSFISVAKGSDEPLKFVEFHYNNAPNTKPLLLVGKGITFDSGGISLKPASNMDKMRADMGGAANVFATIYTLARLNAKVNVIGLTPLCENLPNGRANKPGDVVTAMNGKTIQVDNTDAEGRLILADALCYAHQFDPLVIVDIATLTGAMAVALGSAATGVFSTSRKYTDMLKKCGADTGDRVWSLPLYNHYTKQTTDGRLADLINIGKQAPAGGACIAAAFLREFVTCPNWMHLDIAGVMESKGDVPYLGKGMSGRPMRTLFEFANNLF